MHKNLVTYFYNKGNVTIIWTIPRMLYINQTDIKVINIYRQIDRQDSWPDTQGSFYRPESRSGLLICVRDL